MIQTIDPKEEKKMQLTDLGWTSFFENHYEEYRNRDY